MTFPSQEPAHKARHMRDLRKLRKDAGRCQQCRRESALPKRVLCAGCNRKLRDRARERMTGFTPALYAQFFKDQKGRCAICGEQNLQGQPFHADHDHKTKTPRGLLCIRCNLGLGAFRDSPGFLAAAIEYLLF